MKRRVLFGFMGLCAYPLLNFPGLGDTSAKADLVLAWGQNNDGQLGNGTTTNATTPTPVSNLTSGVTAIATGAFHNLALQGGSVYAWGFGYGGADTSSSQTNETVPIMDSGILASGVSAIAGGDEHSLAIVDGALYAWGDDSSSQLGDGGKKDSNTPLAVSGMGSGVSLISAGGSFSMAVQGGVLYAWGDNSSGQLGISNTKKQTTPAAVTGLPSNGQISAIAAAEYHSVALINGKVYTWGDNSSGEEGDGTTTDRHAPVAQTGALSSGVTAIATGFDHTLAVKNGNVYAWGDNSDGEIGNGTVNTGSVLTPQLIDPTDLNDIVSVAANTRASYALSADGSLWVWGLNEFGELGLGDTTNRSTPQQLLAPSGYAFTSLSGNGFGGDILATIAPVPEPSCLLLGVGCVYFCRRSRRR